MDFAKKSCLTKESTGHLVYFISLSQISLTTSIIPFKDYGFSDHSFALYYNNTVVLAVLSVSKLLTQSPKKLIIFLIIAFYTHVIPKKFEYVSKFKLKTRVKF